MTKIKTLSDIRARCSLSEKGCWVVKNSNALLYTNWYYNGKKYGGHRLVKILEGYVFKESEWALHSCDNRRCVNPNHIFIGTQADNNKDMFKKGRGRNGQREKTHCVRGHEFNKENTRFYKNKRGSMTRLCKVCHKIKKTMGAYEFRKT